MSIKEFDGLAGFIQHLAAAELALHAASHRALDAAAKIVEEDAKQRIGHYQDEAGPFVGWVELADSTKADRAAKGFSENDPLLRTGELRESISREVTSEEAVIGSTSDIAVYQEVGTDKIPPRPFLGAAAFSNKEKILKILGGSMMHALEYGAAGSHVDLLADD